MRKGGKDTSSSKDERDEKLRLLQSGLNRLESSVTLVSESFRANQIGAMSPRYDFVRANKHLVDFLDPHVRRARVVRQSILTLDQQEHTLLQSHTSQLQQCDEIAASLALRNKKMQEHMREKDPAIMRQQAFVGLWLQACCLARATTTLMHHITSQRRLRVRMARVIQRVWRKYWSRVRQRKQRVMMRLSMVMPKIAERARIRLRNRMADVLRTFLRDIKDKFSIKAAVRNFRRRVIVLQRAISEYLKHLKAARARYVAHFERVEKTLLVKLSRDKAHAKVLPSGAEVDPKGARKRRDTVFPEMDWSKVSSELRRMQVRKHVCV
jgi:hypothetical protein